jgi:hypothetical protein
LDPLSRFAKKQAGPAVLSAEVFLKAFHRIGQDRKHQSFFRPPLTLLSIHVEKAMRSENVRLKK